MGRLTKLLTIIFLLGACTLNAQKRALISDCNELNWMSGFLKENHYKEIPNDSVFVEGTIHRFFELFDYSGYYLDNASRARILAKSSLLKADVERGGCQFLDFLWKEVQTQENNALSLMNQDEFWSFDYDSSRVFSSKVMSFNTQEEKTEQWRKYVQFESLLNFINLSSDLPTKAEYLSHFDSLKQSIRNTWDCRVKPTEFGEIRKHLYRAFLTGYDPYTEYFDQEEIALFMSSLSSELKGVGFFVMKDFKGELVITDVIKGSSAEIKGIKKDDRLLALTKDDEEVNLFCFDDAEINQFLIDENVKKMKVVVKSVDDVDTLILSTGRLESNVKAVQSFVLKGSRTIGYISIPTFYYTNESGGGSMAKDMAKEIWKLKNRRIEGLILGLQGNGGGSIEEAIELISLFVDEGDLFQIRDREKSPEKIKNPWRDMAYYGPLMLLVDGMSASASEMVAMVMMEHSRALVVGDTTYGKATAQAMIPIGGNLEAEPEALLKYTTSSWYNLRGKSLNEIGIVPDILLPSVGYRRDRSEAYSSVPSKWKAKQKYFSMYKEELQTASLNRFEQDTTLTKRKLAVERMTRSIDFTKGLELSYEKVADLYGTIRELDVEIESDKFEIEIINPGNDNEQIISWLRKDLTLLEGYHIFEDWLAFLKR